MFVGRAGFEPTKAEPTDLQSAPFDRFGIFPLISHIYTACQIQHNYYISLTLAKLSGNQL